MAGLNPDSSAAQAGIQLNDVLLSWANNIPRA